MEQGNSALEYFIILGIICIELYFFLIVFWKIKTLKSLFPNSSSLYLIDKKQANTKTSDNDGTLSILIDELKTNEFEANNEKDKDVIVCNNPSKDFSTILNSTNEYLQNNKDGVVDFNIVKGISERIDLALERSISSMVSVPLYIGLLGTIGGIIFSLFSINLDAILETGSISMFLNGVKIAMFASFFGLFLTLLNSAFNLKKAVYIRDINKAGYYSFIQANLLPKISSDIPSSIRSLQRSLNKFNINFGKNIKDFNKNTKAVHSNLELQNDFIQKIENIGLDAMVVANLSLLEEFNKSTDVFEKFTSSQYNLINQFDQFKSVIFKVEQILQNVIATKDYFESSLKNIDDKVGVAEQLYQYLQTQYSGLHNITDSTKTILSNQEDRIEKLFESYQSFLKDLVESNNQKVKQLIDESEANIKEVMIDKDFISLNSNVKEIIIEIPELKKIVKENTISVSSTINKLNDINSKLDTLNKPRKKSFFNKLSRKNIIKKVRSIFYANGQ